MKKLPLFLIVAVVLFSTLACGLFTALTGSDDEPVAEEVVVDEPAVDVATPTEAVIVEEEEPVVAVDARTVLFQDDFSDSSSGWDRNDWENGTTDYANGVYRLVVKVDQYDVWSNPYLNFEGDVSVEVDATKVDGELDDDFGVLCRYSGEPSAPNYYFFYISSDGYAVIGKNDQGGSTYLSSDQMQPTDAIIQGYATNHLRADCIGSTLTLYVNDQMVAVATDSSLASGDVGLVGGTFDIPSSTFEFDNFVVYQP